MITPTIVQSLKDAASGFEIGGLTPSERHWMEELSKVYLCAELNIDPPEHPSKAFSEAVRKMTEFGHDSALTTRLILYGATIAGEKDFFSRAAATIATLLHHEEHWSQKHLDALHLYANKRTIEEFMRDYFDRPESISTEELAHYLTFYFKHFYKLLHTFLLVYTQTNQPILYGRAHP